MEPVRKTSQNAAGGQEPYPRRSTEDQMKHDAAVLAIMVAIQAASTIADYAKPALTRGFESLASGACLCAGALASGASSVTRGVSAAASGVSQGMGTLSDLALSSVSKARAMMQAPSMTPDVVPVVDLQQVRIERFNDFCMKIMTMPYGDLKDNTDVQELFSRSARELSAESSDINLRKLIHDVSFYIDRVNAS